eukprot:6435333-Amphidinium_carterae.1
MRHALRDCQLWATGLPLDTCSSFHLRQQQRAQQQWFAWENAQLHNSRLSTTQGAMPTSKTASHAKCSHILAGVQHSSRAKPPHFTQLFVLMP